MTKIDPEILLCTLIFLILILVWVCVGESEILMLGVGFGGALMRGLGSSMGVAINNSPSKENIESLVSKKETEEEKK